jgi:hypothetical protein
MMSREEYRQMIAHLDEAAVQLTMLAGYFRRMDREFFPAPAKNKPDFDYQTGTLPKADS